MDNLRVILFISLCFVLLMLWQAWQADYGPRRQATVPTEQTTGPTLPQVAPSGEDLPVAPREPRPAPAATSEEQQPERRIAVTTDVLQVAIDLNGATLVEADLPAYPVSVDRPKEPFALIKNDQERFFKIQGGLLTAAEGGSPDHNAAFSSDRESYTLQPDADRLEVPLTWRSANGLEVQKRYVFTRGSYVVEVNYVINNGSATAWTGRMYSQLQRRHQGRESRFVYTFSGAAYSSPEHRYKKLKPEKLADNKLDEDIEDGWAALLQHYFVVATIPDPNQTCHYYTESFPDKRYLIGFYGPQQRVEPGASVDLSHRLYVGPKVQRDLAVLAPGLDLTVDYGWLWFIAKPLFRGLGLVHRLVGNWGWSIIIITFLIKLLFYPLSATSYRSMAKMRRVQPRMTSIRERYSGDRARMNQAMMELYKEEKINPLGGCLPIVVQIPVFIALYWVLLESVELRQAPFALWIRDLSGPDPVFVLPLLMGISMFVQQKLNPAPLDPVQAKVMQILPVVFTVFFAFFPAGLVLYWVVNNMLSILQQWLITRRVAAS
jgi:YidC/Oxa1 family membrane protein insertase